MSDDDRDFETWGEDEYNHFIDNPPIDPLDATLKEIQHWEMYWRHSGTEIKVEQAFEVGDSVGESFWKHWFRYKRRLVDAVNANDIGTAMYMTCLLYTSPSPRDS